MPSESPSPAAAQSAEGGARQERLPYAERQFRLLLEHVQDYAIYLLDAQGRISSWNIGAERIKGYTASEVIGQHFSIFYPEEDQAAGKPQRELETAARDGRIEDEGWRVRRDGSKFWANVIITALRESGKLVGFAKITRDFTQRMQAQAALRKEVLERTEAQRKLAASEESLRQLSADLLRSQDEERRRIGRDLHDSLGQSLSMLKLKLDTLKGLIDTDNLQAAIEDLAECIRLSSDCIAEVRTISYLLYPPLLEEMGLATAIPWYVDGFAKRSAICTSFETVPDFGRLPQAAELALFRVLQESLTNVHRHSGSASAEVRLWVQDGTARLQVKDYGHGFSTETANHTGVGLRSMRERMQQMGGQLQVASSPQGTLVTAVLPLKQSTVSPSG
jgi:PAS domain S-box-containing protein